MELNKILKGDCLELMENIEDKSIDMIITSPPYDDIKNYNYNLNWNFGIFKLISNEMNRVLKDGGVIIWVVNDKTQNGSESLSSFKQVIFFNELGLKLYDTMIYKKLNYTPLTHRRYEQEFEYMFCLSKGIPKTFNPIKIKCKYGGTKSRGSPSFYKSNNDNLTKINKYIINNEKIKGNIFEYNTGSLTNIKLNHPAVFPLELVNDQIISWSNENDIILDCFAGSGTTAIACINTNRNYILMEKEEKYIDIINDRIKNHTKVIEFEQVNKKNKLDKWF